VQRNSVTYQTLEVERAGAVTRVWLNRPRVLNALNSTALEEIATVFDGLQRDFDAQVVVLGGRGRAFSAGADRKDPPGRTSSGSTSGPRERRYASQLGRRALEAIERVEAITIARLHGHVIGGATVLALGCDLRIAAADTVFRIPEVELGVPLTWGAVPRLAREVGAARAKELILLGDEFDAAAAEKYGMVNQTVAGKELDATVDRWATRIAQQPEWAVHMTKTQFRAYGRMTALGDVTEGDGDLLNAAALQDPGRFVRPIKS
jgi:enoyl-CoA hydratase/carnithine racemase